MKGLDRQFAADTLDRLANLTESAAPAWGKMTAQDLIPHLIATLRVSMNQLPGPNFAGNWFTTTLLPPIVFTGWFSPPKNIKFRTPDGQSIPAIAAPGDRDTLKNVMDEFITGLETRSLTDTGIHPLFGDIGPQGWAKFHVIHTRHHLKQFRL